MLYIVFFYRIKGKHMVCVPQEFIQSYLSRLCSGQHCIHQPFYPQPPTTPDRGTDRYSAALSIQAALSPPFVNVPPSSTQKN